MNAGLYVPLYFFFTDSRIRLTGGVLAKITELEATFTLLGKYGGNFLGALRRLISDCI